jgi:hypothetical protein
MMTREKILDIVSMKLWKMMAFTGKWLIDDILTNNE